MTDESKDGGPAFPTMQTAYALPQDLLMAHPEIEKAIHRISIKTPGLSKLEFFAGMALANPNIMSMCCFSDEDMKVMADRAFSVAEAMLAESMKKTEGGQG